MIAWIIWIVIVILLIAVMIYYNDQHWIQLCTVNPHHAGCTGR